jgi:hypothetical protein
MKVTLKGRTLAVLSSAYLAHDSSAVGGERVITALYALSYVPSSPRVTLLCVGFAIVRRTP